MHFLRGVAFTLVAEIIIAFIAPTVIETYHRYFPRIEGGYLIRSFSEVAKHLPDEPEDINSVPYESQIPKFIQNDIDRMLDKPEIKNIVYQSKDGLSKVVIYEGESGRIEVDGYDVDYPGITRLHGPIREDLSFYKTEEGFNVYGREDPSDRQLVYYKVDEGFVAGGVCYESSIDLLGVDAFQSMYEEGWNYPEFWRDNKYLTLLRDGNEFTFYHKGQKCGNTVKFPGADIVTACDSYILDSNNDMYYIYYCADMQGPWIHFEKVAESIDTVTNKRVEFGYEKQDDGRTVHRSITYRIYAKNGKEYVAIPDFETEMAYGMRNGEKRDRAGVVNPNYTIETIEISENNLKGIQLCHNGGSSYIYVRFMYAENVYVEHILRGIDTFIDVPEEEIEPLMGTIKPEEYDERIQAIKAVYEKYEKQYW